MVSVEISELLSNGQEDKTGGVSWQLFDLISYQLYFAGIPSHISHVVFIAAGDSRYLGQSGPDFPVLWAQTAGLSAGLRWGNNFILIQTGDQGFLHLNTELTHSRNIIVNCVDGGIVVDVVASGSLKVKS